MVHDLIESTISEMAANPTIRGGISFTEGREEVLRSLETIAVENTESLCKVKTNYFHVLLFSTLPLLSAVILLISGSVLNSLGFIITGSLIILFSAINAVLIARTSEQERFELNREIGTICETYRSSIREQPLSMDSPGKEHADEKILSGHPHISIVTCYRNMEWQRIPTLLLAQGDVIALMAGDITPSRVYELTVVSATPASSSSSRHQPIAAREDLISLGDSLWQKGGLIEAGLKIHLRKNARKWSVNKGPEEEQASCRAESTQKPSYERHRSIASDTTELLALSGDVRCFLVAETPIKAFGQKLTLEPDRLRSTLLESILKEITGTVGPVEKGNHGENSYIRMLFIVTAHELFRIMIGTIIVFLIAAIIRACLLGSITDWGIAVVVPVSIIILCFSPLALPVELLLCEALVVSSILSKAEALLQEQSLGVKPATPGAEQYTVNMKRSSYAPRERRADSAVMYLHNLWTDLTRGAKFSSSSSRHDSQGEDEWAESERLVRNAQDSHGQCEGRLDSPVENSCGRGRERESDQSSDAFNDDDLDERAAENAEEASHRILLRRQLKYVLHTLSSRLGLCTGWRAATNDLLPIPMARARLLEVLGSITMVCFIDDDIICESYSVTEEIFLLQSSVGSEVKTKVLDLHANTLARGARFEDSRWFTNLPSLKPIGLNAMLTYYPFPPQDLQINRLSLSDGLPRPIKSKSAHFELEPFSGGGEVDSSSQTNMWTSLRDFSALNKSKYSKHSRKRNRVELALVDHVRRSMPLEALKELSEEIGFVREDYMGYNRLLEINVIAPRLCDMKVVEDTHAWGQEETRRRGTLASQVRGVVVRDSRGGGLQLMSQGDPSLVLNYRCALANLTTVILYSILIKYCVFPLSCR
jgi:hypothetical protein